jgi:hypothetical protein
VTVRNPGFEDAGALPGEAEHWTLVTFIAGERIAGFGPAPHQAWEDFERWVPFRRAFAGGDLAMGLFDSLAKGVEDFEEGWANNVFLRKLPTGLMVLAVYGNRTVEDFESGWSNAVFVTGWQAVTAAVAVFAGRDVEDFEAGWRENETYARSWADVVSTGAVFGADAAELFEVGWSPMDTL